MSSAELHPDIKLILLKLPEDVLFALAATVTQGLLKNKLRRKNGLYFIYFSLFFLKRLIVEAIEGIIKYSPNELSILKRKAVTKEVLFEYLHQNNVGVPVPTTKSALIDKICNYWNLPTSQCVCEAEKETTIEENTTENLELLGEKFAEWFYNMLNTSPTIGPEHFWSDAELTLNLISDTQTHTQQASADPEQIAVILSSTKNKHNLFFNPNLTKEGVKTKIDPHGLAVVMVCGTLHTHKECVGVFEQIFGLARDPFSENNWKIKNTRVDLRSKSGVTELPKLSDQEQSSMLSITQY